ncbi:protein rogdi homolog isoform X5 [Neopsephotus bourkii]|uniref:protein rogdi homolog isoform X5 n=1 Tax=Neopsephotus bourkii TaxID=309878 RepID=UPI002AA538A2|nr:protein rogdi homolog isoform X5 [Neopsephotus bourkii]
MAVAMASAVERTVLEEEFKWLLQEEVHVVLKQLQDILKIQDARNHINQAIYLLMNRDVNYQFKTGSEVLKLMDAVMLQLSRARNRLTTPATLTLPEIASSGLAKMFTPALPPDILVNFYINLNKLCLTVYQLHVLQPSTTKNVKLAGGSILHNPGAIFEFGNQRYEVSHVHKVECVVPWLNDALVFFAVSLQLCQQLKDKAVAAHRTKGCQDCMAKKIVLAQSCRESYVWRHHYEA